MFLLDVVPVVFLRIFYHEFLIANLNSRRYTQKIALRYAKTIGMNWMVRELEGFAFGLHHLRCWPPNTKPTPEVRVEFRTFAYISPARSPPSHKEPKKRRLARHRLVKNVHLHEQVLLISNATLYPVKVLCYTQLWRRDGSHTRKHLRNAMDKHTHRQTDAAKKKSRRIYVSENSWRVHECIRLLYQKFFFFHMVLVDGKTRTPVELLSPHTSLLTRKHLC